MVAMEAQAVGRVQRIGQKTPTVVHYIVVKDSIESKMWGLCGVRDVDIRFSSIGNRQK